MARFYDGKTWTDVLPEKPAEPSKRENPLSYFRRRSKLSSSNNRDETPVAPVLNGNEKILVTIPSFRDGERCGKALLDLFHKADKPENVVVSLVEQQHEDDIYCVEAYCKAVADVEVIERVQYGKHAFKVFSNEDAKKKCPRIDQIRVVRVQDVHAKGPPWARALGRRSLGNEEFCLQASTDSVFATSWDVKARKEWLMAHNEFAIISNPPQPAKDSSDINSVPRTCSVKFLEEERLPHFDSHADGKVEQLKKPLLAHTWTPGFSFAKCHLEEAAPSDGFLPFLSSDVEAFARYARMWTRGYDVYTPTNNIVYHQSLEHNPHKQDWINSMQMQKSIILKKSLNRIRLYLEISREESIEKIDNLGIYGIGKRRTLKQLDEFLGINLATQESRSSDAPCGNFEWVPYNSGISPMDNLYSNPDDLDPQPEFPLRTNLTFAGDYISSMMDLDENQPQPLSPAGPLDASRVPYGTLFVLWVLGLVLWCKIHVFSSTQGSVGKRKKRRNKNKNK